MVTRMKIAEIFRKPQHDTVVLQFDDNFILHLRDAGGRCQFAATFQRTFRNRTPKVTHGNGERVFQQECHFASTVPQHLQPKSHFRHLKPNKNC
jgi:hypothetical protein